MTHRGCGTVMYAYNVLAMDSDNAGWTLDSYLSEIQLIDRIWPCSFFSRDIRTLYDRECLFLSFENKLPQILFNLKRQHKFVHFNVVHEKQLRNVCQSAEDYLNSKHDRELAESMLLMTFHSSLKQNTTLFNEFPGSAMNGIKFTHLIEVSLIEIRLYENLPTTLVCVGITKRSK